MRTAILIAGSLGVLLGCAARAPVERRETELRKDSPSAICRCDCSTSGATVDGAPIVTTPPRVETSSD